jgi:hypothetical protein
VVHRFSPTGRDFDIKVSFCVVELICVVCFHLLSKDGFQFDCPRFSRKLTVGEISWRIRIFFDYFSAIFGYSLRFS